DRYFSAASSFQIGVSRGSPADVSTPAAVYSTSGTTHVSAVAMNEREIREAFGRQNSQAPQKGINESHPPSAIKADQDNQPNTPWRSVPRKKQANGMTTTNARIASSRSDE